MQELSKEQFDFLNECEKEFKNRYTDADEDFFSVKHSTPMNPPILDPWPPRETQKTRRRRQRQTHKRHSQRHDYNREHSDRHQEDRYCLRDDERRTKQKKRNLERNKERSAEQRKRDRIRHKSRRSEGNYRKRKRSREISEGNSYRDEDRGKRRDNKNGDKGKNSDNHNGRKRSKDSQKCQGIDFKDHKKEKATENNVYVNQSQNIPKESYNNGNNQQDEPVFCNMHTRKHTLYENYRPYF